MKDGLSLGDFICCGGTPSAGCDFCGRIHYAVGPQSDLDDELREQYLAAEKENPGKYVPSCDDSIAFGMWDGKQFVWGCPCGKIQRYEEFLWENRRVIIEYIKARNDEVLREACDTAKLMEAAP